jgi:glycosyltransferase involved in cell wall biosynthesis
MKVGFILSSFLPRHTGGTEIYVYRLICELQKFNISCFVLNSSAEEFTTTYIYKGIRIIPVLSCVSDKEARFKMLEQIICDEQPDLFHVHELTGPDGFTVLDLEFFRNQNIPVVTTLHVLRYSCFMQDLSYKGKAECDGLPDAMKCTKCFLTRKKVGIITEPVTLLSEYLFKYNVRLGFLSGKLDTMCNSYSIVFEHIQTLHKIIACSNAVVAITKWYHSILQGIVPFNKLNLIQTGAFLLDVNSVRKNAVGLVFGYLGRLTPDKGIDLLIDAFISMKDNPNQLKIYADISNLEDPFISSLVNKTKFLSNVHWCKPFQPDDVKDAIAQLDVVVVPTRITEMSPLVIHEAKAMGKFILASSNRGNNEILSDFKNAYTYQENTVHALALALQHVQHKLLDFSEFTKPDKVYTFETTARQYLSLYNSLLNNSFESNYSNIPVNLQT